LRLVGGSIFFPPAPILALRSSSRAIPAPLSAPRDSEARIPRRVPSHSIAFRRANSTVEHRSSPFCRATRPSPPTLQPSAVRRRIAPRAAILVHRRKYQGRMFMTNDGDGIFLHVDHARKTRGLLRDAVKLHFNIFRTNTRRGYYNSGRDQRCSRPRSN